MGGQGRNAEGEARGLAIRAGQSSSLELHAENVVREGGKGRSESMTLTEMTSEATAN